MSERETRLAWDGDKCACVRCGASHRAYLEHDEDGSLRVRRLPRERYCYGCGARITNRPWAPVMTEGRE